MWRVLCYRRGSVFPKVMLSKFFAASLIVLAILPFTAPFSSCDLAGFMGVEPGHHTPIAPSRVALTNDAAVPAVPFVSAAGRGRLLPLGRIPLAESATFSLLATSIRSLAATGRTREHTVLGTILRV
jgi:hypothetical protein